MRNSEEDHLKKLARESSRITRLIKKAGHPEPLGDPASGILIVVEQPVGPRAIDALQRSLEAVKLADAYVTWTSTGALPQEILCFQPPALVSIGPEADQDIDALNYPLSKNSFSEATHGAWFPWTSSVHGLSLPALAPALRDEGAKRTFWRAFLTLQRPPSPSK